MPESKKGSPVSGSFADIHFFGEVDFNKHGKVGSEYPAWMFERNMELLEESIAQKRRMLKKSIEVLTVERAERLKNQITDEEKRLSAIKESKPKYRDTDKDMVYKEYRNLEKEIQGSLFTYTDMQKGIASPNEEARRMMKPCIRINVDLARKLRLKSFEKGYVSRDDASVAYKILGGSLNENTNVELLRRDKLTASGRFKGVENALC